MSRPLRVLIVEDSADDAELLLRELRRGGFEPSYRRAATPEEFVDALDRQEWDLILCDFTLAGFSGTQALSLVRSRGIDIPFIFVSGTISEETAVAAMRAGAQDYVIKNNLRRLVPAIERELREVDVRRDRQRAEAERRVVETRFREVLAMAPDAIVGADKDQRITIFNRAAEALFGYDAREVSGHFLDLLLPSRLASAHRRHLEDFARGPVASRRMSPAGEVFGRRKNGEEFPAEASISRIFENGRVTFMAIVRDITERRLLEEQLRQAQKMEAVGELTGGLAHDFNNLLTIIIGNLDLVQDELAASAPTREAARVALDAGLRGAQLTRQLLAFSRRQPLQSRAFDLNALASATIELLRRTLGQHVEIEMDLAADLWPALADPTQLESALANLAINARDAMPGGGRLAVETANRHLDESQVAGSLEAAPGDYVLLSVSDNGTGIAPEHLDKVFEPFFTTKAHGKGSGLGLSMVYGFARQSGGHIEIASEIGRGTSVRLYLPRASGAVEPEAISLPGEDEAAPADATILVVEDDAEVRDVAVKQLRALGYRVFEAESGAGALALLETGRPVDLLLTDVVMPGGLSGPDVAREGLRLQPSLKVLFTSGYAEGTMESAGGFAGTDKLLMKPYRRKELARAVRDALTHDPGMR